jgi:tetratricopeptide (TPR) repeat protein
MKKVFLISTLLLFLLQIHAQDESSYMMIMVKQKKSFKMARGVADYQELANSFERIANAESDQWHPLYYAALCYINMTFSGDDVTAFDGYLDKAQTFIDKALAIYPDESEIHVLQALLYQARIRVDPAGRGMTYSIKANESLVKALEYNDGNPRAYYLQAMNVLGTPKAYGGGPEKACPIFQKADETYKSHKPDHVLSPTWGGERNSMMMSKNCL